MRHPTEGQFVLYHYRELNAGESAAVEEHLDGCEPCRRHLAALERELAAVTPAPVPGRPADYGAQVWARLQPRLAAERASRPARAPWWRFGLPSFRPLAYAAGVAVIVVAAFVAGRSWSSRPAPQPPQARTGGAGAAAPQQVRERILVLEVGEHLERSQAALLEVMNAPGEAGAVDLSDDQDRVRDLVAENRLYRLTAIDAGENGMAAVLDELERALVEIANSPARLSETEFDRVRDEIDAQGLILKVGVLGDNLRRKQATGSSI